MPTVDQLRVLCTRLARELESALLDRPLDELQGSSIDSEACELLLHCFEAGIATSLRELVADERLVGWIEQTCTVREGELVTTALQRLLGAGSAIGPDDPERLAQVDPLPSDERALRSWARRYDVLHELTRPAREVLPNVVSSSDATLAACVLGPADAAHSLLAGLTQQREAQRYLLREASCNAAQPAREALWARMPALPLRRLVERLRALLEGHSAAALRALRFSPARPVSLSEESGLCEGRLVAEDGSEAIGVRLHLAGFEQRAIHAACRLCARQPCPHSQALAGRALDACLDVDDRLHATLLRFVSRPSWQLFFDAAQGTEPRRKRAQRERLAFVLRLAGDVLSIGVQLQSQAGDGSYSSGRLIAPARALSHAACRDPDRALLDLLVPKTRTLTPSVLPVDLAVLRALSEHPQVSLEGARGNLTVVEETLEVRVLEQPDGLRPEVRLGDTLVRTGAREKGISYLLSHDVTEGRLRFAPLTPALKRLLLALDQFRGVLPKESFPALASYLASLDKLARVASPKALLGLERPTPKRFLLRLTPSFDEGVELTLSMRPFVLSGLWPPGAGPELVHGLSDGVQTHVRRDLAWEKQAAPAVLAALDLNDAIRVEAFRYRVESSQAALALLTRAARLAESLEIEWAEHAGKLRVQAQVGKGDLKVALFKRGAFFFPEGRAENARVQLAFSQLLDAARRNERFVRIEGNDYAEIESELFERLRNAQLCVMETGQKLKLSTAAAPFWLQQLGDVCAGGDAESHELLAQAGTTSAPEPKLSEALDACLRVYQRDGLRFLLSCARFAPGALLADEMGLGKTVQSIAFLCVRSSEGPALVVCPTSLVDNWCSELARFAPELRALRYRGEKRRELLTGLCAGDVLMVSYELLARDRQLFEGLKFSTQIVDEAQVVKNARTLRARAAASIDAEFRVALSGTPVENRLGDLWSLFHLIAPGLLGAWPRFRARFAVPIERYDDRDRATALRQLVSPIMLRRRKDDVEHELPARTDVVQLVALSAPERELYASALAEARRAIGHRKPDDPGRRLHILAELTRLRQLACHPRLVIDDSRVESSKLAALMSLLNDVLPRGHRVLIFSQFVAHLSLIREELERRAVALLWLSGSTPGAERAELVARFQRRETQVFLISLKAGGTGLNLTAADYVVHMDPWWNPSAEEQASDRAHRIGQGRPVTVVKLVAQDTIEERVLALHQHKRRLAASVLEATAPREIGAEGPAYEELLQRA